MILRYLFGWFILLVAAIANASVREEVYRNAVGELAAHQISTLTGIVLFGVIIREMSRRWPLHSSREAWTVGVLWGVMTMCFEFLFGHFVMGHPWSKLLYDYNLLEGRVWILMLLWIVVAPYLFRKLQQRNVPSVR